MKDLMIDIETLGTSHNACMVQFGACFFDRDTGEIGKTFKTNIDIGSSIRSGFSVTGDTISWWFAQSEEARKSITSLGAANVFDALYAINEFMRPAKYVWSHATFDFVILMNHFKHFHIEPNVHYRSARDIRTLVDLANIKQKRTDRDGVHHDALDDCLFQVKYCVDCFNAIRKGDD